jgi:hypothetical protein
MLPDYFRQEADILDLKEKIKLKEKAAKGDTHGRRNHTDSEGWTRVHRKKALDRQFQTLKINGKYKLVIGSADDEARSNCSNLRQELRRDCNNRILV